MQLGTPQGAVSFDLKNTYFRNSSKTLKEAPVTEYLLFLFIYSFSNDRFTFKNLCHVFFLFFVDFSRQLIFYHANEQLFS